MSTGSDIEVYWMPGCTSCMRMKEFIDRAGKEYVAINVDEHPERAQKIRDQGLLVPVACIGERCVNGVDLAAVADLIGAPFEPAKLLHPAVLVDRFEIITDAFVSQMTQMPAEGLAVTLPGRKRPMMDVAAQVSSVMRAFLSAYYEDRHDVSLYDRPVDVDSSDLLIGRMLETQALVADWWRDDGYDDELDRVVNTYWGYTTLHELLEREVWHTAQHARQVMFVLESFGVQPAAPITGSMLRGLPVPEAIHG